MLVSRETLYDFPVLRVWTGITIVAPDIRACGTWTGATCFSAGIVNTQDDKRWFTTGEIDHLQSAGIGFPGGVEPVKVILASRMTTFSPCDHKKHVSENKADFPRQLACTVCLRVRYALTYRTDYQLRPPAC